MLYTVPAEEELLMVRFAAAKVCSGEPSPQFTTVEPGAVVKSAIADEPVGGKGLASVKVPSSGPTMLGAVTGIGTPSMPLTVEPLELVSEASSTVTPPPDGLVR